MISWQSQVSGALLWVECFQKADIILPLPSYLEGEQSVAEAVIGNEAAVTHISHIKGCLAIFVVRGLAIFMFLSVVRHDYTVVLFLA